MSKIFHAGDEQVPARELQRVLCKSETLELQNRLFSQPELLAGDQMRPEDPRKWLLIAREMPVNSPSTGLKEFSLDFLYVDQEAIPTFVEVKRRTDPRSRREVVGQMLEYAANGRAYWETADLVQAFLKTNGGEQIQALDALKKFRIGYEETLETYFEQVVRNLREGVLRLVFFVDDSSYELRSIVEFLNEEFETVEVLIVEARQYELEGMGQQLSRIIVPHLIGFSERVRIAKQRSQESKQAQSYITGETNFWKQLTSLLTVYERKTVQTFIENLQHTDLCKVKWIVSCILLIPSLLPNRGLFGIRKNGELEIYLAYWSDNNEDVGETQASARERFLTGLCELGLLLPTQKESKFPLISRAAWIEKSDDLLMLVKRIALPPSD